MNYIEAVNIYISNKLTNKRYKHSLAVGEMSKIIANKIGYKNNNTYLAGLSHDIAREHTLESLKNYVYNWGEFSNEFYKHPNLYHGPVGAYLLQTEFHINDKEILEAVAYHSVGHRNMCTLAKIVYVADYISRDRVHIDESFREEILSNPLDVMVEMVITRTEAYLKSKNMSLIKETKDLYKELKRKKE